MQTILVNELFGPLVGWRLVSYKGYWVNGTDFVAVRDGIETLRRLTEYGSKRVKDE